MTAWRGIMGTVAEACGEDVAHALMDEFAGSTIYIPKAHAPRGLLSRLGDEAAEALVREFGNEKLYIPSRLSTRPDKKARVAEIEKMLAENKKVWQIAAKMGISERYIMQLLADSGAPKITQRKAPAQLPLFED